MGISAIAAALAAAQGEMTHASKSNKNEHFRSKYADLASVIEACRGPLSRHEIAVVQVPEIADQRLRMTTRLIHSSGEELAATVECDLRDGGPQALGSAATYLRRYGLMCLVGVAADDDDGEAAEGRGTQPSRPEKPREWSAAQRAAFIAALPAGVTPDDVTAWCVSLRRPPPAEMSEGQRQQLLAHIADPAGGARLARWMEDRDIAAARDRLRAQVAALATRAGRVTAAPAAVEAVLLGSAVEHLGAHELDAALRSTVDLSQPSVDAARVMLEGSGLVSYD